VFRRLFWLIVGVSFGFGLSFWLTRLIKQRMERYAPRRVTADLTTALRQFGQDLKYAAVEGREAMREHEAVLRADLADHDRDGSAGVRPPQPARSRRPDGRRERPLRATGRLRIDQSAQVEERQEARR
jgi:hypothetical protein